MDPLWVGCEEVWDAEADGLRVLQHDGRVRVVLGVAGVVRVALDGADPLVAPLPDLLASGGAIRLQE